MSKPKAYGPEQGFMYQILTRHPQYNGREWEHCDYAVDGEDLKHLMENYREAYRGFDFKVMILPKKYWGEEVV